MSRASREAAWWERLWLNGQCDRAQVRDALRALGVDESHIIELLGPEPVEAEDDEDEDERSAAA